MTNLWEETIEYLAQCGKSFEDVCYIQGSAFQITKENFEQVAKKSNYDSGYGSAQVAKDLVLVGADWWLEREEHDGAEWWVLKDVPQEIVESNQLIKTKKVKNLIGGAWYKLSGLNDV